MDSIQAKQSVLQQLIDMMDNKMLGGVKKKGEIAPAGMTVEIEAGKDSPLEHKTEGAVDDMDPDMLQKLLDMYSSEEKAEPKKKEDEEDRATQPTQISASN